MCGVTVVVDKTICRAIAKIAFNYLAHFQEQEFLHHETFDPVRRFIRHGEETDYKLVESRQEAILENEPIEGQRVLAHLLTTNVAADGSSIVGQVALFNHMTYCVSLARNFKGDVGNIRRGHIFDVGVRQVSALGVRPQDENQ